MSRPWTRIALATLLVPLALSGPGGGPAAATQTPAPPSELSDDLRSQLEAVMVAKMQAILGERNEEGASYRRGNYSRQFRKVANDTYQVTYSRDTASKDVLTTERFLATLKSDGGGAWKIVSEDLKDTHANMFRDIPGDEEFFAFDGFAFKKEGLTITSGKGYMIKDYLRGKLSRIGFAGEGLKYEFAPGNEGYYGRYRIFKKSHEGDVVFEPETVLLECDESTCPEILALFKGIAPSSKDQCPKRLLDAYEDAIKDVKKNRKDNPFTDFRSPLEPGRKTWYLAIHRRNPEHGISLQYDNWNPKEVTFSVFNLDRFYTSMGIHAFDTPVYSFYSEETLKKNLDPYALEKRDDADAHDIDLAGLEGTVELGLEDAERLDADLTYTLTTKRELSEIPFFIFQVRRSESEQKDAKDPALGINSIQDGEGNDLTWVKTGAASGIVVLPKPVPSGTPLTLKMNFTNMGAIRKFSPTFAQVTRFGWLPFVRFTDPIPKFDLTTKILARNASFKALGIGRQVSDTVENGVRVTRWTTDSPVEFPSITYGEYKEMESKVEAKKIDGTKIPVWIHVDKAGLQTQGPGISGMALQNSADQAANSLNLYREIYGVDYPYAKLDLVNDPQGAFYGQSPSSLIYLGWGTFLSQGRAGDVGGDTLSKFNREVVPHEVGHQWWGSLIPNANNGNYWFVESLAEYSCALYVEATDGKEAYLDKVERWRRRILDVDLQTSVQGSTSEWGGALGAGYQAAVYNKGPYAFHIMRSTWGDDKFFAFLKMLAQDLKNKAIVTRDIQKVAEKAFGGNMDFFFDQWLRGVGQPEYTFTYGVRQTEDGKFLVEGKVDQRVLLGRTKDVLEGKYFTAIVPVIVTGKDGKEYRVPLKIQGASTPFRIPMKDRPKDVHFNKYGESLAYDVIVKKTA